MELKDFEIKRFLDSRVEQYNCPAFIKTDPVQIPHQYRIKEDIEIAAFLTATLAWGQRITIINKSLQLMKLMDNSPFSFLMNASDNDFARFDNFCHRTFNATDALCFLMALKNLYIRHGGLQKVFTDGFLSKRNAASAIAGFRNCFIETHFPERTLKHVSDVTKGSAAKRLNMFLRWMVRNDGKGVDFGIWKDIDPSWLSIPLDLHAGNTARKLGLLNRKYNDWQAVEELTNNLRQIDAHDPVKYDFALFGIGAFETLL